MLPHLDYHVSVFDVAMFNFQCVGGHIHARKLSHLLNMILLDPMTYRTNSQNIHTWSIHTDVQWDITINLATNIYEQYILKTPWNNSAPIWCLRVNRNKLSHFKWTSNISCQPHLIQFPMKSKHFQSVHVSHIYVTNWQLCYYNVHCSFVNKIVTQILSFL